MSLILNLPELSSRYSGAHITTLLWLTTKISYDKLLKRVARAYTHPEETTKCVLMEYSYTSRQYVQTGLPNIVEYVPNKNVLVHHALNNPEMIRLMDEYFGNNQNIKIYVRQKIKPNGTPDFHRKQLVVKFEPWTYVSKPKS